MEYQLTTADVYETASLIGKDMEQIIENFGHVVVMDIMPKIIKVLEQLEVVVGEQENGCLEIEEMRLHNERLLTEVKREASQRRRLDEEFFQYKQTSTREISELNNILEKLKDENQALQDEEKAHKMEKKEEVQPLSSADLAVLKNMKIIIDTQRDTIRSKNSEVENARQDLEAMEEQVERLANINETIRRNLTLQKSRNSTLAQEKADLEADTKLLRQQLSKGTSVCDITVTENTESKLKISENEDKIEEKKVNAHSVSENKDPNRPRFTLKELQRVLKERNELKEEVIFLKEDLAYLKKCRNAAKTKTKYSEDEVDSASLDLQTSPYQERKDHGTHKSGISKLFKFLWKDENKTPTKTEDYILIDSENY